MNRKTYSQLGQDLFISNLLNNKKNGYFVEIGVGDGENTSNTCLFEREFGWAGILCEPHPGLKESILRTRTSPLETSPVWKTTGDILEFGMCNEHELSGFTSTFNEVRDRNLNGKIQLTTISLNDVLEKYKAPIEIDYISLDTEGSEFEILKPFDFKKYNVKVWTIEHNSECRKDGRSYLYNIIAFMGQHGYSFKENGFDGYFISNKIN